MAWGNPGQGWNPGWAQCPLSEGEVTGDVGEGLQPKFRKILPSNWCAALCVVEPD